MCAFVRHGRQSAARPVPLIRRRHSLYRNAGYPFDRKVGGRPACCPAEHVADTCVAAFKHPTTGTCAQSAGMSMDCWNFKKSITSEVTFGKSSPTKGRGHLPSKELCICLYPLIFANARVIRMLCEESRSAATEKCVSVSVCLSACIVCVWGMETRNEIKHDDHIRMLCEESCSAATKKCLQRAVSVSCGMETGLHPRPLFSHDLESVTCVCGQDTRHAATHTHTQHIHIYIYTHTYVCVWLFQAHFFVPAAAFSSPNLLPKITLQNLLPKFTRV